MIYMNETKTVTQDAVFDALREVVDPELGINLVDLGLIYGVEIDEGQVQVDMTLTTPGCPMHSYIARQAWMAVNDLPGVAETSVRVVWEPRWTPDRLSPAARAQLGIT
jgi:metal-sulfur cluster biosynthetic enzyme